MKNHFLSRFLFVSIQIGFISCNHNDETEPNLQEPSPAFFNLNTGNQWVYKKYYYSELHGYQFSGITDSVSVIGTQEINGNVFAKVKHNKTNGDVTFEYQRIDTSGHLVGFRRNSNSNDPNASTVFHPGMDLAYQKDLFFPWGKLHFFVTPSTVIEVEGNSYNVLPYKADFTPADATEVTKTTEYNYQVGVGLIKSIEHAVAGDSWTEERLVSYHIN